MCWKQNVPATFNASSCLILAELYDRGIIIIIIIHILQSRNIGADWLNHFPLAY